MATIFTKIIQGEIPSFKIYEDEYTYAFLDIHPVQFGHTLVVPKTEVDNFLSLDEPYYTALFQTAKKVSTAIQQATGCARICTALVGYEVPHVHYHLIPTNTIADFTPTNTKEVSMDDLALMQQKILQYLP